MNAAPTIIVGGAFMRPWRIHAPLVYPSPVCNKGGMNAAPTGARRGRIYAPLGIYASVAKLRQGRHECRPYNYCRGRIHAPLVYPSTVCGQGGMNAAPTGARRGRIHAPLAYLCAPDVFMRPRPIFSLASHLHHPTYR